MKVCVYTRPDGGVSIMRPVPWARLVEAVMLDDQRYAFDPPISAEAAIHFIRESRGEKVRREIAQADVTAIEPTWAESEDDMVRRIASTDVPATATNISFQDDDGVLAPVDDLKHPYRRYRNALTQSADGSVDFDMPKAREIHLNPFRQVRKTELAKLDVDQFRAWLAKDDATVARIEAEKQMLRDVPQVLRPMLDAARTPHELAAIAVDSSQHEQEHLNDHSVQRA